MLGLVDLIINGKTCKNIKCNDGIEEEEVATCPTKVSCPLNIPKEGSCKFDVGSFKDGQRGTVTGDYQYDEFCKFSVRVKSLYANSGLVSGNMAEVAGSDNYNYTAKIINSGLVVISSAGQKVCELDFK